MFSPAPSDISQNNAEALEKQWWEVQQRYKEEQRSLLRLQEAVKACHAEHVAQKARREAETKAKEEAALLEGAEGSQVAGSKRKEVAAGDEEEQRPSKKARGKQPGKYRRGAAVKMGGSNPCERCVCAGQDCLVHPSRWVINLYLSLFLNNSPFHSCSLACAGCITLKQRCVPYTNTNTLAMIPTYGGVLSAIALSLES